MTNICQTAFHMSQIGGRSYIISVQFKIISVRADKTPLLPFFPAFLNSLWIIIVLISCGQIFIVAFWILLDYAYWMGYSGFTCCPGELPCYFDYVVCCSLVFVQEIPDLCFYSCMCLCIHGVTEKVTSFHCDENHVAEKLGLISSQTFLY